MNVDEPGSAVSVEVLRRTFDQAFASAPRVSTDREHDLLALTIGGDPYALRLSEISGLHADRKVRWLPGSVPELRGLVALRGALLPAYDLRALLGYPGAATAPRWCVVTARPPVALTFEQFDGHLRAPGAAIDVATTEPAADRARYVREVVHGDDVVRSVIHVPSVLEAIEVLVYRATRPKE